MEFGVGSGFLGMSRMTDGVLLLNGVYKFAGEWEWGG